MAQKYLRRPYGAPLNFLSTNSPSNVLAASGGTQALVLVGDVGVVTVLTHLSFKSDGPFLLQIRPSDLNAGLFKDTMSSETLLATLDRPGMLPAPIVIRGANSLRLELTNDNGAIANNVRFSFWGYRDYKVQGDCAV